MAFVARTVALAAGQDLARRSASARHRAGNTRRWCPPVSTLMNCCCAEAVGLKAKSVAARTRPSERIARKCMKCLLEKKLLRAVQWRPAESLVGEYTKEGPRGSPGQMYGAPTALHRRRRAAAASAQHQLAPISRFGSHRLMIGT